MNSIRHYLTVGLFPQIDKWLICMAVMLSFGLTAIIVDSTRDSDEDPKPKQGAVVQLL